MHVIGHKPASSGLWFFFFWKWLGYSLQTLSSSIMARLKNNNEIKGTKLRNNCPVRSLVSIVWQAGKPISYWEIYHCQFWLLKDMLILWLIFIFLVLVLHPYRVLLLSLSHINVIGSPITLSIGCWLQQRATVEKTLFMIGCPMQCTFPERSQKSSHCV